MNKLASRLTVLGTLLLLASYGGGGVDDWPKLRAADQGSVETALTASRASEGASVAALVRSGSGTKTAASAEAPLAEAPSPSEVLRSRQVDLDLSTLLSRTDLAGTSGTRPAHRLAIAFFDDAIVVVEITRTEATASGGTAYTGLVPGVANSIVVMVNNHGVVSMSVMSPGAQFTLQGSPGSYAARQLRPRQLTGTATTDPAAALTSLPLRSAKALGARAADVARDDGSTIDVMVVYSPAARTQNGGKRQMEANIDAEVALTNAIYANSKVVQRLRLVYRGEHEFVESGSVYDDLYELREPTSTRHRFDEVRALRDIYRADIVSLWGAYSSACGHAEYMVEETAAYASRAYNVVSSPLCTSSAAAGNELSFARQLGKNMGLLDYIYGTTVVTPEGGGPLTQIDYAHAHADEANRFFTIMGAPCAGGCIRAPHFSNPDVSFDNRAHDPSAAPAPTGTASANEAQALNDTRDTVANFRVGHASLTAGPGIVAFTPFTYHVGEGSTVQLTVRRHAGATGPVSVAYSTVDGNGLAGFDYAATSGTLTWADGDSSPRTISVPIAQDALANGERSFSVRLSEATGGASFVANTETARVYVTDDEAENFLPGCAVPDGWTVPLGEAAGRYLFVLTGWGAVNENGPGRPCSLKSSPIEGLVGTPFDRRSWGHVASIRFTATVADGNIAFRGRVSGNSCLFGLSAHAGYFNFLVDGVVRGGTGPYRCLTGTTFVPVSAGTHVFTLEYVNTSVFRVLDQPLGTNAAWIDFLSLPLPRALPTAASLTSVAPGVYGGSVAVAFQASASAGSSPITGYTVTCVAPGQRSGSVTGSGSPLIVTGLAAGAAYRCSVAATNSIGTGSASALSTATTPRPVGIDLSSDFDLDGKPDILFQNTVTGDRLFWLMNGLRPSAFAALANVPVAWQIAGTGDFNRDGKPDIVWQNLATGERVIWFMNGTTPIGLTSLGIVPVVWRIAGTGDFDGDGQSDILWQHRETGEPVAWLMDGSTPRRAVSLGQVSAQWQLAAAGDFNADGKPDLLWQHTVTGQRYLWLMDGVNYVSAVSLGVVPLEWSMVGASDLDGDGATDIVWQHTVSGERVAWLMQGPTPLSSPRLGWATTEWSIAR